MICDIIRYDQDHVACVWAWLTLLSIIFFQFHPFTWKFHGSPFLYSWVIYHYARVPHFPCLFSGWWASLSLILWIKLQWTRMYKCLCGGIQTPLSVCPGTIQLTQIALQVLAFCEPSRMISTVTALLNAPTNNRSGLPLLTSMPAFVSFLSWS